MPVRTILSALTAAAAMATPAAAQSLGLWAERVGEGVRYLAPAPGAELSASDPVSSLPPLPASPVAAPVARPVAAIRGPDPTPAPAVAPVTVGNLMAVRPHDPSVPLPHPDLQALSGSRARDEGPRPFFRGGDGGGVLGFRLPIKVDRGSVAGRDTTSGGSGDRPVSSAAGR